MSDHWPKAALGELLAKTEETTSLSPDAEYREVTVKLWGRGVVQRGVVTGAALAGQRRFIVRQEQFILSRIDARNGALGLVPPELDGAVVSNDFPAFNIVQTRLLPAYLGWLCRTASFVEECKRASEGTTNRVRLQENKFLAREIRLPSLAEQQRIVARIEELADQVARVGSLREEVCSDCNSLLTSTFQRLSLHADRKPLSEVAPLNRRPVAVDPNRSYPQVAARSFGRGTFHREPLVGADVTWQKPFLVRAGDILVSNIKAWEGAIAVATAEDDGHVSSHRYLTFVPQPDVVTSRFACFYLLTPEGLHHVGEASPGSADRNRTTSVKALLSVRVPVPPIEDQKFFDELCIRVDAVKSLQTDSASELDALLPAILDRAFKGEL